ncbi:hypothetical protein [Nonomuraea sediminis]|uniref:hypothetical protein n=1 Tax=Nonomuraea sediminis TaxID=2835864 RepID=UPI001BDBE7CB|nr:hypothetical protein [Nonomuraea sediminis]
MAGRVMRRSAALRAELALVEDLEPIEDAHLQAKQAYEGARASGDPEAIRAAKQVKVETANRLNETREWLRREAEIVKLQTVTIPKLEGILAKPMLVKHGDNGAVEDREARAQVEAALKLARKELEEANATAVVVRRELEALGAFVVGDPVPPDLPPGSADVTAPSLTVKPQTGKAVI